jgi:hypothetical protein
MPDNSNEMYRWTFRYEVPKDANRFITVTAADEETARETVNQKLRLTIAMPFEICEVVAKRVILNQFEM